ncbi:MAG: hypothetical protein IJT47_06400, partial [Selenomonadaceae bacterium]|nr:hypothetical protein [Selenomonadaceae bacterium]
SGDEVIAKIESGGGSYLWGSENNNSLYGTDADDIFIGGKNQGTLTFRNVSSRDIVYLNDVTLGDLSSIKKENDMVTFNFKTGNSVTIQSTDTVSGAVVLGDSTWHFTHPPKN